MQVFIQSIWSNKNYRYSLIILGVLLLWLLSGLFVSTDKKPVAKKTDQSVELPQVRARYIDSQLFPMRVFAKGKTQADRRVDVKAEVPGLVEEIPVARGELVEEGDVICRLATEDRESRVQEAQASVEQAKIEYEGSMRLKSGGFQSETAIATSKYRLETAQAQLLRRKIDLEKTAIRAPFAGVVDTRPVEVGTLMRLGDTCATVLDLNPLVIMGEVSESDVVRLSQDSLADVKLSGSDKLQGKIRYISRQAEETTRTFRVEVAVENPQMTFFSGITADISVHVRDVQAHLIPAALLMLDDDGKLGVRTLDEEKRVQFHNIQILGDAPTGVWVTGLPERSLLITVGQEYVGNGEEVSVTFEDAPETTSNTVSAGL